MTWSTLPPSRLLTHVLAHVLAVVLVIGCAQTGSGSDPSRRTLGPELLPFAPAAASFNVWDGQTRTLFVEPAEGGNVRLRLDGVGVMADVRRGDDALYFSDQPGLGTPLIRFGAAPGAEWTSGETTVRFTGWERLDLPGGPYDAAHITESTANPDFRSRIGWWFVPDVGLVQVEVARDGLETRRMNRVGP